MTEPIQEQPVPVQAPQYQGTAPEEEWQNELCGCFDDMTICLLGCCCPCIVYGQTRYRLHNPNEAHLEPAVTGSCAAWFALEYCTGCAWILNCLNRGDVRRQYNIRGTTGLDCCISFFCGGCAICQEYKEVRDRENARLAAEGSAGYAAQQPMTYTAPPTAPAPAFENEKATYNPQANTSV
ncbi:Cell number regulator 10 [Neolecta irregularis DAH-3]|uniref:Cell number regulator 10 n=1 Tax=Neolecta irregularis (strain DAH-3) TaxID=1198029 RepID=A0A1U7LVN2_NEOID|nr:Cell number regulator 10 [Neolecta irregularis DAH-3]|eukprot:OLL26736.1 Cell number regulator 10 [Neolecta irregularis DAH-3]